MTRYGLTRLPSLFEVALSLKTSASLSEILRRVADLIARAWPPVFRKLKVFGCCDAGGGEIFIKIQMGYLELSSLRLVENVRRSAHPQLGNRFDTLHPLMFGSAAFCRGLARALGKDVRYVPLKRAKNMGLLRVNPECDFHANMLRAKRWFVAKEENEGFSHSRQLTFKNKRFGYVTRRWHPNGILALEVPEVEGRIEGVIRQWNSQGKLLGSCEIKNGNGILKAWNENGTLEREEPLAGGEATGRHRYFSPDGSLQSESYWLDDDLVSKRRYFAACKTRPSLPRYE